MIAVHYYVKLLMRVFTFHCVSSSDDVLTLQVTKLEAHREALTSHMHSAEDCCAQLVEQVKTLKDKWCATCVENVKLYKKIFELRKALNPGRTLPSNSSTLSDAVSCAQY